jgi:ubiquinone/menaquinone biosynthesis C-methylase UbiE
MTVDHYAGVGPRWAAGASLVYGPVARQIVALSPHPLKGRVVLDVGAGTGVVSSALVAQGARPVAADYSYDMLAWRAATRPPAAVADICALPLADASVDDSVAAFVLNHLVQPATGFAELIRVTRPGGAFLAGVYSNASHSAARDRVDETLRHEGWRPPEWYLTLKSEAIPILGSAEGMARTAKAAGLVDVTVDERAVDVGVTEPEQLVAYRLGQAPFTAWLEEIGPRRAAEVSRSAVEVARPIMGPYRPTVVFLSALVAQG